MKLIYPSYTPPLSTPLDRSPSQGPRVSVVRLGDNGEPFGCEKMRGANYPPFE